MAAVDAKVVKELLEQIESLIQGIQSAGHPGLIKLKDINVEEVRNAIPRSEGKLDAAAWSALDEEKQNELHHRLIFVRGFLNVAAELDGPRDPEHIMYAEYASNRAIVAWASIGFLLTALLLGLILSRWSQATGRDLAAKMQAATEVLGELVAAEDDATKADAGEMDALRQVASAEESSEREEAQQLVKTKAQEAATQRDELEKAEEKFIAAATEAIQGRGATEGIVLTMVVLLGALGGSLHLVGSLVKYVGNRQLKRSWLLHYLAMPIIGAALAPMVYMLVRVGLVNPSSVAGDGSGIANLNLIAIYAFAALTGLFARTATEKLSEVFSTLFRTESPASTDALGAEKPPGGAEPASGQSP